MPSCGQVPYLSAFVPAVPPLRSPKRILFLFLLLQDLSRVSPSVRSFSGLVSHCLLPCARGTPPFLGDNPWLPHWASYLPCVHVSLLGDSDCYIIQLLAQNLAYNMCLIKVCWKEQGGKDDVCKAFHIERTHKPHKGEIRLIPT